MAGRAAGGHHRRYSRGMDTDRRALTAAAHPLVLGTVPMATIPAWGLGLAYEGATERWVWHVQVGLRADPVWVMGVVGPTPDLAALLATVQPVAPAWFVIAEIEALWSVSPVHIRALARHDLGRGWTADAGLAAPVPVMFQDPTLQVLARVERRW